MSAKRDAARTVKAPAPTKKKRAKAAQRPRPAAPAEKTAAARAIRNLPALPKVKRARASAEPSTRAWVLERLAENVRRAMRIEAVTLRGVPTPANIAMKAASPTARSNCSARSLACSSNEARA